MWSVALTGGRPVPELEAQVLPSSPEPTRKPIVALAICGAVLLLPLALSAPGGGTKADEIVLAAGAPDGAVAEQEPTGAEAGEDPAAAAEEVSEEPADAGAEEEDVAVDDGAGPSSTGDGRRQAAVVSRRPAKATARSSAGTSSTVKQSTATTKATAARAATTATAATTAPPTPAPPPPPPPPPPVAGGDAVWDKLAMCESGNTNDPGAPYYGYWQFSEATWHSLGEAGLPDEHSRARQLAAAKRLQAARGWAPWPECSRRLGLV